MADRPDDFALTEEMVAEPDQLDPLVAAVDEALSSGPSTAFCGSRVTASEICGRFDPSS